MSIIGHRIRSSAIAGVLYLGLSRSGMAQMADKAYTANVLPVNVTVYGRSSQQRSRSRSRRRRATRLRPTPSGVQGSGTFKGINTPRQARDGSGYPDSG